MRFGPYRFSPAGRRLTGPDGERRLTPKVAALLAMLLGKAGEPASAAEIAEALWPGVAVGPTALRFQVAALRKALGGAGDWVRTVSGGGYAWAGPAPEATPARPPSGRPRLAIPDFADLSAKPSGAWLGAALAALLGPELTAPGGPRLIPRERLGGSREAAALRAACGADWSLEGSHLRQGAKLRLTLALRDCAAGETLASLALTGPAGDLFALVDEAARRLRAQLGLPEPDATRREALRRSRPRPEALRDLHEGLARLRANEPAEAILHLEAAAREDGGGSAVALALARAYALLGREPRAREWAACAHEASAALPRETRLRAEAARLALEGDHAGAAGAWRRLWEADPGDLDAGLELSAALVAGGRAAEALAALAELREQPGAGEDPRLPLAQARACNQLGQFAEALAATARASRLAGLAAQPGARAEASYLSGFARCFRGEYAPAREDAEAARGIYLETGDRRGAAYCLNLLAEICNRMDDAAGCARHQERMLAEGRALGNPYLTGVALSNLASRMMGRGELAAARAAFSEAEGQLRDSGNAAALLSVKGNLAILAREAGDLGDARARFEAALEDARQAGNPRLEAYGRYGLGATLAALGEEAGARMQHRRALELREKIGDALGAAESRHALAALALREGRVAEAETLLSEGVQPADPAARQVRAALLALAALARGALAAARAALEGVDEGTHTRYDLLPLVTAARARLRAAEGRTGEALETLKEAEREAEKAGLPLARCELALARLAILRDSGDIADAGVLRRELARLAEKRGWAGVAARLDGHAAAGEPPGPRAH